jgi:hypothetical protein
MITMNKKFTVACSFLLLLLCANLVGSTFGQTSVAVGVSQGDSFKYDLTYFWSSTSHADFVPASLVSKNQTDYYQITIDAAAGTSLRVGTVWRFDNGTEITGTDIEEVGNTTATGFIYVYAANLTSGSYLFPSASDLPFLINNTAFRTYKDEFRSTNHIAVNRTDLSGKLYSVMDLYFDKSTGVLVEATLIDAYEDMPNQIYTTHIALKESSLWAITQAPTTSASATSTPGQTTTPTPTNQNNGGSQDSDILNILIIVLVLVFVIIIVAIIFVLMKGSKKASKATIVEEAAPAQVPSKPGMVICSSCGHENPEGNEFCGKCGARLK